MLLRMAPSCLFRMMAIGLIGLVTIASPLSSSARTGEIDVSSCVHALVRSLTGINEQVTTVNIKNGQVSHDNRPTIPPDALFSPDRKMAFFFQAVSDTQIALYIQSITQEQPILLDSLTINDFLSLTNRADLPWAWAPDSSRFAYISSASKEYALTLVDTAGTVRKIHPILASNGSVSMMFYGWSADSSYVATAGTALDVWSGKDLTHVGTGLALVSGFQDMANFAAWAPHGHRLAVLSGDKPTTLSIWSPEHGIEAATPVVLDNEIFKLHWAPDESALQLASSTGHTGYDEIFTLNGNVLLQMPIADRWPTLIGWTKDGNAIVYLWYSAQQLLMLNTRTRQFTVLASGDFYVGDVSPDGQLMLLTTQQGQNYRVEISTIDGIVRTPFIEDTLPDGMGPPGLTFYSSYVPWLPMWSPNSRYVAREWYTADHKGIQTVIGQPGSPAKQVINGAIVGWIESGWLIYVDTSAQHLRLLQVEPREQFDLGKVDLGKFPQGNTWISVSPDKRTLIRRSQTQSLQFVSLNQSNPWIRSVALGDNVDFYDFGVNSNPNAILQIPQSIAWASDSTMAAVVYLTSATKGILRILSREGTTLLQAPFDLPDSYAQLSATWGSCT